MTETKHTPGPWEVHSPPHTLHVCDERGYAIADMAEGSSIESLSEKEANARLIAAAPDLLEALERITYEAEKRAGVPKAEITKARTAIAKAKGGAV